MSKHDEQYISKFQNSKFKVWVHIEEINEDEDYYQDVGEPISIGREFDKLSDAATVVDSMWMIPWIWIARGGRVAPVREELADE